MLSSVQPKRLDQGDPGSSEVSSSLIFLDWLDHEISDHAGLQVVVPILHIFEPPSKSIVYAWYKNISYRSLGGALSLSSVLFKSTRNIAKMQGY